MRRLPFLILASTLLACGAADSEGGAGDYGEGAPASSNGDGSVAAGQLTVGAWDDNRNYEYFQSYLAAQAQLQGAPPFSAKEHEAAFFASGEEPGTRDKLDIALVIDTTGSMGDEISYLRAEFRALTGQIEAAYPNADQRWALSAYRDRGDSYLVQTADFTGDLDAFQATLTKQRADGGGDYPEAPEQGLQAATQLSWRSGSTARLLFWLADAPHHVEQAGALAAAVRALAEREVHVYPIAASGTDELTELSMRSAAQLTLGRYLFLTDDSGIGDSHKEPTIPCYYVTRLDQAIARMVDIEMRGVYREPSADQILRTGGDPEHGLCTLADGQELVAF